jgi:uncharacterized protein (DUF302 family)
MPANGLVTVRSPYSPEETMNRLEAEVACRGMKVFARIDHAASAEAAGLGLQPTELLVFGDARGSTPLMQAARPVGVDLPLRVLVWQDEARATWLTYNDPCWVAQRHGVSGSAPAAVTIAATLGDLVAATAHPGAYPG